MQYSSNSFNEQNDNSNRRQSSGTLASPDIDMGTAGSTAEAEHDGFYMLKKDSQRRTTLARVLAHDQSKLCKVWLSFVRRDFSRPVLTDQHLEALMKGLRDYITSPNKSVIEQTMCTLREQLCFDPDAVHQLHFSLYSFQDAAKSVLRMHNIKPHWMFALDNLVHSAVQAAITVLKPDFEDNIAAKETKPDGSIFSGIMDDAKNSSPSFGSSIKSHKTDDSCYSVSPSTKSKHELQRRALMLHAENRRLLEEVLDCRKSYNGLLRKTLEDQKDQTATLKTMAEQQNVVVAIRGECRCYDRREYDDFDYEGQGDAVELVEWLRQINTDERSIKKVVYEEFRLDQLRQDVTRDDLRSLGLKRGAELKLWKEIERYRETAMTTHANYSNEDLTRRTNNRINNNRNYYNAYDV